MELRLALQRDGTMEMSRVASTVALLAFLLDWRRVAVLASLMVEWKGWSKELRLAVSWGVPRAGKSERNGAVRSVEKMEFVTALTSTEQRVSMSVDSSENMWVGLKGVQKDDRSADQKANE